MDSACFDPTDGPARGQAHTRQPHGDAAAAAPLIGGRSIVRHAQALVAEFGVQAGDAAGMRAAHARAQDNPYTYCLWREVERAINWMDSASAPATRH